MKNHLKTILFIPFLLGCATKQYTGVKIVVEYDDSGELTVSNPQEMYDVAITNEKSSIFYIGDDSCKACAKLKPQLESWVKAYKGKIYYIALNSITSENIQYLYDATEGYYQWSDSVGIPATYFFMEKEVAMKGDSSTTMNYLLNYVEVEPYE